MYNSNVVAPPVMNHEFKVQGGWIRGYLLAFILLHIFVITPIEMLLMLLLRIPEENTLLGVIGIGLIMGSLWFLLFLYFFLSSKAVIVYRQQLVLRKILKKTAYTCSDIVAIECNYHSGLKTGYYYIELVFRDQTKFQVEKHLGNFKVFAIYLLQMLDAGVISEYAVHPLHRERLHMYAQGKVFRR